MSYFATCSHKTDPAPQVFSAAQIQRMQHALTAPQRAHLLNPP
jgi:hypothetical protein